MGFAPLSVSIKSTISPPCAVSVDMLAQTLNNKEIIILSVLKSKRKASQFEVFNHYTKLRKEVTLLLLNNFGYSEDKAEKYLQKQLGGKEYEELSADQKIAWQKRKSKMEGFVSWFIPSEKETIVDCLREITSCVYGANSIYPQYYEELIERRLLQDKALGQCYRLTQELQYAIEVLPVDIDKYTRFAEMIQAQINLIKGWRKADNKFKRVISESASHFANVNNNGNANYNTASNTNGVRPDFDVV